MSTLDTAMTKEERAMSETRTRVVPWVISHRGQASSGSVIREITKRLQRLPDAISFAGGLPAPETFPVDAIRECFDTVLRREGKRALQYGPSDGYPPLRAWIAETMSVDGVHVSPDQVLIVSGSQQGLELLGTLLLNEGDAVLVETPTYVGALQALALHGAQFVSVRSDEGGLIPSALAEAAQNNTRRNAFLYTIPSFQNPTGNTFSEQRRIDLVDEAARLGLPIIEDDPYGWLDHQGTRRRTLHSLNPEGVVFLGSFSKVLSPGIRLGYVVVPATLSARLERIKQAADLHTSMITQMAIYELLKTGFLDSHLPVLRQLYRRKCDAMIQALGVHFPAGATWCRPEGGMFVWVTLPEHLDATALLEDALDAGVAFVPGSGFYANAPRVNTMRLSFATVSVEQIETGIERLGRLLAAKR
jgi:2-aminoadipate transaminase